MQQEGQRFLSNPQQQSQLDLGRLPKQSNSIQEWLFEQTAKEIVHNVSVVFSTGDQNMNG